MAITVGSVEVDVIPNTRGIYPRLRSQLEPVGRRVGSQLGEDIGRNAARQISLRIANAVRDGVRDGGRTTTVTAGRQGSDSGGAFGRAFQQRVRAAMANLPRADVRLSDTGFNADLARLRSRLETLSGKRIGVDVDAARALAEVETLDRELQRLGASHPDIQVRVDTGRARAELAALRAQIQAADSDDIDVRVDIDTRGAMSALLQLSVALAGIAAIPAVPVLAAGLGAVAAAGTAAAAGVGALAAAAVPAILDMVAAAQAQKAAQEAAATATANAGQVAAQAASRALQLESAQEAVAQAHRNAARQIQNAEQAVTDAVRQAAVASRQATAQVRDARQALADTYRRTAEEIRDADERVEDAEEALADAQADARQAQLSLAEARREARRELEDMNASLAQSRLDERQAVLDLAEAEEELRAAQSRAAEDPLDPAELERLQLAYERAQLALEEQRRETRRLEQDTDRANAAGVEGSDRVTTAQERLTEARRTVAEQEEALAQARQARARQEQESAREVARAQEQVAEAQRNASEIQAQGARDVARAQEQLAQAQQAAADSIAGAQRQVAAAQLSAAGAADTAATAEEKYRQELAAMTPATRETYDSFLNLKEAFQQWSRSLQPAVMPIFTRALNGLRRSLPGLTPFVREAADAIGELQDRASRGFRSRGWREFKRDLLGGVRPAIIGIGRSIGNIGRGLGGIIAAFLPHMDAIEGRMVSVTDRFGDWGQGLKGSPEFEGFLSYAAETGPQVAETVGDIVRALLDVGGALEPLSGPALEILGAMAEGVSWVATEVPGLVQALYLAFIATKLWTVATVAATVAVRAWAVAQRALNFVMSQNPLVRIALLVGVLVAAVIYAYNEFGWFRKVVQGAWEGIQDAAEWAWENVLEPVFNAIADAAKWVWKSGIKPAFGGIENAWESAGDVVEWLWEDTVRPAFRGIASLARWLGREVVRPVFDGVEDSVRGAGGVFRWLWRDVVRPVTGFIGDRVRDVWRNGVRPAFDAMKAGVRAVGEAFRTAKDAIKNAWDRIADIAKAPVNFVINRVYNDGIRRVWNYVVGAFGGRELDRLRGLATGGVLPGYTPGRDVHLAALSGGEAVMRPEWTRAVGPGYVDAMNTAARSGGVAGVQQALGLPGFALGGIVGDIWDGIGDVAGGAWDRIKGAASWLTDAFGSAVRAGVRTVVNPLIDLIPGDGAFTNLLRSGARSLVDVLLGAGDRGDELATPRVDYNPSAGVEQWRPVVAAALREIGQSAGLADTTLRRMQQESGGNPTAVNRTDVNWQLGHPSVGLMQVIGPTFAAYAGKYLNRGPFLYGTSVDPLANVYSSMRYALSRYGSLSAAYNRPGGYDSGGWLMPGQLGFNGLREPEAVLTPSQWQVMTKAADRPQVQITPDGTRASRLIVQLLEQSVRTSYGGDITRIGKTTR